MSQNRDRAYLSGETLTATMRRARTNRAALPPIVKRIQTVTTRVSHHGDEIRPEVQVFRVIRGSERGLRFERVSSRELASRVARSQAAEARKETPSPLQEQIKEAELRLLYAEFADEDRSLAEAGLADYGRMLSEIDGE